MLKILSLVWLILLGFSPLASGSDEKWPVLFTDRGFCVSGDTLWVMLKFPESVETEKVVIRFQLEAVDGKVVENIAVVSDKGCARGFLPVADSLSSGQYFVTAFQLNKDNLNIQPVSKPLLVYNRFDEEISVFNIAKGAADLPSENGENVPGIHAEKEIYKPREKVNINFELPSGFNLSEAVIKATLLDPLEKTTTGHRFDYRFSPLPEPGFIEKNGCLVSGKVRDIAGNPQPDVLVVISLPALSSFFDYYVTDSTGNFYFFLKNAFGSAEAVFQVFSASTKKYQLELDNQTLQRDRTVYSEQVVLTVKQTDFIKNALNSSFASHIFYPAKLLNSDFFSMEPPDSIPFYGIPSLRVHPEEFIDLPDFREISRELLHGFQYRIRNNEIVFRMLNRTQKEFFREEPLRLINGIPVFDNQLFASLKSTDIEHVDLVLAERIYGEMILNGVIEVSLKDKSNSWLGNQHNLFRRNITLLQPSKSRNVDIQSAAKVSEPDIRQVFIWEAITGNPGTLSFGLSDRKGVVEISIEGFTTENRYFKSAKTIEVK